MDRCTTYAINAMLTEQPDSCTTDVMYGEYQQSVPPHSQQKQANISEPVFVSGVS